MSQKILEIKKQIETEPCIALLGAGYWGRNLVRNFYNLGALKTVCDPDPETRESIKKQYKGIKVTDDPESVWKDKGIKAVVIATPAALHFELAFKALSMNKHVFVEKPLALAYEDGKTLVELAGTKGKLLFVGHILHYHPAIIRLKELINQGAIGRIQYIYSRRLSLGKIRREENILWSFAPHDISVILSIAGEDPSYIDSIGNNFLHANIADVTVTNLKFPSGIGAHIFVSWLNPFKEQRLVIVGSNGMLVFDDTQPVESKLMIYPHTINWQNGNPVPEKAEGKAIDIIAIWEEPLKAECRAFLSALSNGSAPISSGDEGLRVLRILETSQRCIEKNNSVTLISKPVRNKNYYSHPSALIDDDVIIGENAKIWHFSHILRGSKIGRATNIGQNVVVGPDVNIGEGCKIQNNVSVYKGVKLEDFVFCGPSMVFTNVYNPRANISKMSEARPTLVKYGATIGANATIVCGVTIGHHAFIGAGAVVTRDVPDHALMVGNPARQIGWVCYCGERLNPGLKCSACRKVFENTKGGLRERVALSKHS